MTRLDTYSKKHRRGFHWANPGQNIFHGRANGTSLSDLLLQNFDGAERNTPQIAINRELILFSSKNSTFIEKYFFRKKHEFFVIRIILKRTKTKFNVNFFCFLKTLILMLWEVIKSHVIVKDKALKNNLKIYVTV